MKKNVVSNRLHSPSRVVVVVVVVVVVGGGGGVVLITLHFISTTQSTTTGVLQRGGVDEENSSFSSSSSSKNLDHSVTVSSKKVKISLHFCAHNTRAYSQHSFFSNDDDDVNDDDDFNSNIFECSRRRRSTRRKRRKRRTKTFCPSSSTEGVRSPSDVLVVHVHFLFLLDLLFVKYDIIQHAERSALLLEQLEEPQRLFHRFR